MFEVNQLIEDISKDLTSESTPVSSALRKSKILASKIDNKDFENWLNLEILGYGSEAKNYTDFINSIPNYRIIQGIPYVKYRSLQYEVTEEISDLIPSRVYIPYSVKELEDLCARDSHQLQLRWEQYISDSFIQVISKPQNKTFIAGWHIVTSSQLSGIIEAIRYRLLDFILKIEPLFEDKFSNLETLTSNTNQISQIFYQTIYNYYGDNIQGDKMTTFNQQNQQVEGNQYNAGRDINLGDISNQDEFVKALEALKIAFAQIKTQLDEEIATDAEYEITKAIQQSKKSPVDKGAVRNHLEKVRLMFNDVAIASTIIAAIPVIQTALERIF